MIWEELTHATRNACLAALAIVAESPERGTSEDLQRKARPEGECPSKKSK
jgi:hypothetical protein